MKAIGKYVRECCGKRLPGKYQFCPICGAAAKRPAAADPASLILIEIDKRARSCEGNAEKMRGQLRQIDAGTFRPPHHPPGDPVSDLPRHRKQTEKSMASYAKSGFWYRSVEKLITELLP